MDKQENVNFVDLTKEKYDPRAATLKKLDEDQEPKKSLNLFGVDILQIPCARNSILYSVYSGTAAGLLTFLFTSRGQFSMHTAVGVYTVSSIGYWCYCRYKYVQQKFEAAQMQEIFRRAAVMEGTKELPTLREADKNLVDV